MTLLGKGALAAAEIAFFSPALVVSVFVVFRHGFSRQLGWFYLVMLSILRLIGASCVLYAVTQNDYSAGLLETAAITSSVGTAPLLLALMGFLERVHLNMEHGGLPLMLFRPIHLLSLVGLILAIVGGVESSESDTPSPTGNALREAASILFVVTYLCLAFITMLTYHRRSGVVPVERKLIYAGLAALPFLLVRMAYTVTVSFAGPGSAFYFQNISVWPEAFMEFLPEAAVVTMFAIAGLMTPKAVRRSAPAASQAKYGEYEIVSGPNSGRVSDGHMPDMEAGGRPSRVPAHPPQYQQQPRSLGDYRPSRLIRDAISGRR